MDVGRNGGISFWYDDMGGVPERRAPLDGDADVDVCIVGAGFTGLWTAWYLKAVAPDISVLVVEREFAGFGASGRNGGWCTGGFSWSRERYLESGTRAGVMAFERALSGTVEEIVRVAAAEGIDADILATDCLTCATTPAQLERLKADFAAKRAWDVPEEQVGFLDAAQARARIRVAGVLGAVVRHGVARVQPAKLVRGLAAAVERRGVRICEGTTALRLAAGRVETTGGTVTAHRIVRATEGFTAGVPGSGRALVPLNSAIVATEPVPAALWDEIGWQGSELLGDASHAYCYAQRTREGRILMGGRGVPYRFGSRTDVRGETQPATVAALTAILHRLLPQTRGLRLDRAWCGVLGVPRDWCATVGLDRRTGIGWAGGYVGLGVSTSNLAGRMLADLLLGRETDLTGLPWVDRTPRPWEPEPLRWLGIHAMYRLYHLADAREAAGGGGRTSRLARLANRLTGR